MIIILLAGILFFVASSGVRQPVALLLPFYLFMVAHGMHQPCGQSGCVGPLVHGVAFWATALALVAWTLVQKFGEPLDAH